MSLIPSWLGLDFYTLTWYSKPSKSSTNIKHAYFYYECHTNKNIIQYNKQINNQSAVPNFPWLVINNSSNSAAITGFLLKAMVEKEN